MGFIGLIEPAKSVSAQTAPEFITSWRALNYVPADYQGKSFPINSTYVEASFDLLDNNKIVNLSKNQITWTLNNTDIKSGLGAKSAKFLNAGVDQAVRVSVDYKDSLFETIISVPTTRPEMVIDSGVTGRYLSLKDYTFAALPYFFNISNLGELSFNWTNNGKNISGSTENPGLLKLSFKSEGIPQQTNINISASVSNLGNMLETAGKTLNLILK